MPCLTHQMRLKYYSKVRKYVDSCSANQPPATAGEVSNLALINVQLIVAFYYKSLANHEPRVANRATFSSHIYG